MSCISLNNRLRCPKCPKRDGTLTRSSPLYVPAVVAALDEFLSKGLSPNFIGPDGRTLLTEAVLHSQSSLVSSLLEWGADPALADKNGSSPLEFAQNLGRQPIVALLRTHNADAQRTRGGTKPAVQSRKNPVTTPEKPPKLNSIETISQPPKRTSRGLDAVLVEAVKTFSFDGVVKAVLAGAPCTEHLHITADGRIKNAPLIQQCISCLTERVRLRRSKQVDVRAPTVAMVGAMDSKRSYGDSSAPSRSRTQPEH